MLAHFPEYVRIGRELADLHLRYEKPVSAEELGVIVEMRKEDYTVVDKIRLLFLCSEMFLIRRGTAQGKQGHKDRIRLSGRSRADCAGGRRHFLRFRKAEAEKAGRKRSP